MKMTEMTTHKSTRISLPHLSEECIRIVLLKLPVKSLLRFKCVSKSWVSLISSPDFKKHHLKVFTEDDDHSPDRVFWVSGYLSFSFFTCPLSSDIDVSSAEMLPFDCPVEDYDPMEDPFCLVGSCNGLVCLAYYQNLVLWNPATRKFRRLPHSGTQLVHVLYGFGYDEWNDNYKVIEISCCVSEDAGEPGYQCRIYSLRADRWRSLNWTGEGLANKCPGVFLNGAIHWVVCYDLTPDRNWDVLVQSVVNETSSHISLPNREKGCTTVFLGVSGGLLLAFYSYDTHTNIWILKDYGVSKSWSRYAHIRDWPCIHGGDFYETSALFILRDGAILCKNDEGLVIYEPIHGKKKYISGVDAVVYRESLISPSSNPVD